MKSAAILLSLLFSVHAFAAGPKPGQKFCVSDAEKGRVTVEETTAGVEVHLFDKAFLDAGTIGNNPSYPKFTKFDHALLVEGATLQQVYSTRVLRDALVSLLYSMPDDGDRDMAYSYANDFIQNLQCR